MSPLRFGFMSSDDRRALPIYDEQLRTPEQRKKEWGYVAENAAIRRMLPRYIVESSGPKYLKAVA